MDNVTYSENIESNNIINSSSNTPVTTDEPEEIQPDNLFYDGSFRPLPGWPDDIFRPFRHQSILPEDNIFDITFNPIKYLFENPIKYLFGWFI